MGQDDRDPQALTGFEDRLSDVGPMTVSRGGGLGTSVEALAVLRADGVDAWRRWVSEHSQPRTS